MISRQYVDGRPLQIDDREQFLFDDYIVEDRFKLTRTQGETVRAPNNPIYYRTEPWENIAEMTVLYDEEDGLYKAWTFGFDVMGWWYVSYELEALDPKNAQRPLAYVMYAQSRNGVEWEKPLFDLYSYMGYDRNNIVYMGRSGRDGRPFQVLFNPDKSDPAKRFMMVTNKVDPAYSPDGIHWTPAERPLLGCRSDTKNHLSGWKRKNSGTCTFARRSAATTSDQSFPRAGGTWLAVWR